MYYSRRVLVLLALQVVKVYTFPWDIVEGVQNRLEFFYNGTITHTEVLTANEIISVTYDPVHYRVFFSHYKHPYYSISSFDLSTKTIQPFVTSKRNNIINIFDYDPVTQLLFWHEGYDSIYSFSLYPASSNKVYDGNLFVKLNFFCVDIAVDSCGGYLYWIAGFKIERARFDGSERKAVIDSTACIPTSTVCIRTSIAIDQQTQKMYWIGHQSKSEGYQLSIESADLEGKNETTLYILKNETSATSLTVSKDCIYWRGEDQNRIWQLPKYPPQSVEAKRYSISHSNFCEICQHISANSTIKEQTAKNHNSEKAQNYCLQGDCSVSAEGLPNCRASGPVTTECKPTVTKLRGGTACAGQTIFEENFETLRDSVWQIEQYLPVYAPNFPFVSYQRLASDPTVSVSDGKLRISPKLQQSLPGFTNSGFIYNGAINLFSGCTSSACMKQAWGADILPPIVSGKITSMGFAFTYGTVTVRAKLPQGDWIYPEILLEPFVQKYGRLRYSSGVLQIASARGNKELKSGTTEYSNKVLFGGPIMDFQCHDTLLSNRMLNEGLWGDDYHEYSVRWAPDRITLSVDGVEWARVDPTASGLRGRFPTECPQLPHTLLQMGSKMAPFDDHFYITLGVGAGSITEFPDGVTTVNNRPKPWSNPSRKALLNFWQDMSSWLETWNEPQMLVDYVKVVAL